MDGLWFGQNRAVYSYFTSSLINVYNSPRHVTISDSIQAYEDEQE